MSSSSPLPCQFQEGDVIDWVGDSLTQSATYLHYIQAYYLTRFPKLTLRIQNRGIAGDTARGAFNRLDWDVLAGPQPSLCVLSFAGNDIGGRSLFLMQDPDAETLRKRKEAMEAYPGNLRKLALALKEKTGCRLIFQVSPPFDETSTGATPNSYGANAALAQCREIVRALAAELGAGLVDYYSPFVAWTEQVQQTDRSRSIFSPDRVHPESLGHLLMAWVFLKTQEVPGEVSTLTLGQAGKTVLEHSGCEIHDLEASAGGIRFTLAESALPFPIDPAAREALALIPLEEELNRQILRIRELPAGSYSLRIDEAHVGDYTAAELDAGVNLATNPNTPQYAQAHEVWQAVHRRGAQESHLRKLAQTRQPYHLLRLVIY